ncbi:MAG: Transport permease protein [Bacteroidetes bacterium]|nr:Transport permease protein [Bacteroidota bacterium]
MRLKWKIFVASLKMFFRQREAIIWTILMPLFMITLFGFVKFDGVGKLGLGIVNEAGQNGVKLMESLKNVKTLKINGGVRGTELAELEKGERDMVLVISSDFRIGSGSRLTVYFNDARPQEAQLGQLVLQRVLDEIAFEQDPSPNRVVLAAVPVKSRNLTYIDFLIPGILSMSIMQMGIFGVAFGFVQLKKRGILRRLWVTPIRPSDFILGQVMMRLLVVMAQICIMIGVGVVFFDLHFIGSFLELFFVGMLGAIVFLSIGFALAGIAKSEDQVAPAANIIALPMMLLSGIFFSRNNLPGVIHTITDYLPLTYLADSMRSIAIDGATLTQVAPQLLGLGVWCVISCSIAVKMFRWE